MHRLFDQGDALAFEHFEGGRDDSLGNNRRHRVGGAIEVIKDGQEGFDPLGIGHQAHG